MNTEQKVIAKKIIKWKLRENPSWYHLYIVRQAIRTALNYGAYIANIMEEAIKENEVISNEKRLEENGRLKYLASPEYHEEKNKTGLTVSPVMRKWEWQKLSTQQKNLEKLLVKVLSLTVFNKGYNRDTNEYEFGCKYYCEVVNNPSMRIGDLTYRKDELKGLKITIDNII